MKFDPDIAECSIVLLGQFNPSIFHPSWFVQNGVVSGKSVEDQKIEVIHPELAVVSVGDISLTVELHRFAATIQSSPWVRMADLVSKTFGELLIHTPIHIGGINVNYHSRVDSMAARTEWGRRLVPLDQWGEWGKRMAAAADPSVENGMRSVTMLENWRTEGFSGHWQVQVEPSTKIADNAGVYFAVNHQFAQATDAPDRGAAWVGNYVHSNFDRVISEAQWILDEVFEMRPRQLNA